MALGYLDGNVLPVEKLAAVVASITNVIEVPLSVDIEACYTDEPKKIADKLKPIIEAGAVGINIEDGEGSPDLLVLKIEQARENSGQRRGKALYQCSYRCLPQWPRHA